MKKFLALFVLLLSYYGNTQTSTVNYVTSSAAVPNPERGFYKHTETHSASYSALDQNSLTSYRENSNITLILRVFYLENFVNSPISSAYLTAMQSDFVKIRNAGIKCIVRFAYSDNNDSGQAQDATKAQILSHINQLKPILLANADIIPVVQVGFIGAWGEWYYTDNFGMDPTATDYLNRRDVVNALLAALPAGKMVQMRTPSLKQNTFSVTSALSLTQAYSTTNIARVGHHNDCFLASADDYGTYNNPATEYPYLEQETKYVPMGGETCAINAPRSQCASAIVEMARFHWSFLNLDYHPGVIAGFSADNCFSTIENRLGYRFELVSGTFPQTAGLGQSLAITLKIKNSGFASPYNQRTTYLVMRNTGTGDEIKIPFATDMRFWNPGTTTTISENLLLPANTVPGNYKLFLDMPDNDPALAPRPEYAIKLANNNIWEGNKGYNDLQQSITVTSSLGIADHNATALNLTVYPVPTNNELVMEMDGIEDFHVSVYNSLGQKIVLPSTSPSAGKMTLDTQTLSNGVYIVSLENNRQKETRRIVVSH